MYMYTPASNASDPSESCLTMAKLDHLPQEKWRNRSAQRALHTQLMTHLAMLLGYPSCFDGEPLLKVLTVTARATGCRVWTTQFRTDPV